MKAGLTVLVAIASASVNAHVKVETVNFDEDLLNSEKNIAGTFAWKEKAPQGGAPSKAKPDINVTFKFKAEDIVRKFKIGDDEQGHGSYECTGDLTIRSTSPVSGSDSREKHDGVTLVFYHTDDRLYRYNGLYVRIQADEKLWMSDSVNDNGDSKYAFQMMEDNYQRMPKLYDESQRTSAEKKQTNVQMEWTISKGLEDYDEMVNNTAVVKKVLEPKKKAF